MKYILELIAILALSFGFISLLDMVTAIPVVKYYEETVDYKEGYPQITVGDVVEITDKNGKYVPREKWAEVLSSGRYDPAPVR